MPLSHRALGLGTLFLQLFLEALHAQQPNLRHLLDLLLENTALLGQGLVVELLQLLGQVRVNTKNEGAWLRRQKGTSSLSLSPSLQHTHTHTQAQAQAHTQRDRNWLIPLLALP